MTEIDWLSSIDSRAMLGRLPDLRRISDRKIRLFGVACCRRIWPALTEPAIRTLVDVAEQTADGLASAAELRAALDQAMPGLYPAINPFGGRLFIPVDHAQAAAYYAGYLPTTSPELLRVVREAAGLASRAAGAIDSEAQRRATAMHELRAQAHMVRCIFGPLPFRPVQFDASCRTPAAIALAMALYQERQFDDLPILADALEEAGCDNPETLGHLRQEGQVHVRGCWCLDLVLGKE